MKTVVISGGSGNDSLLKGLHSLYKPMELRIIVNAYDDGKSTGVCRNVTHTLGVSDIRKNHARLYSLYNQNNINANIVAFYSQRYDLPKGKECEYAKAKLDELDLSSLKEFVDLFFANQTANKYDYFDFSIANIVYSAMYQKFGYEKANELICEMFKIPNIVLMNSFENVCLSAVTTNNNYLSNEAAIVDFANTSDKINKLVYDSETPTSLNPTVIKEISDADLLVISCGTFWSSIYPTLQYGDLYKAINRTKAFKVFVMNNTQDKDAYHVGSNEFIDILNDELGLDMSKFVVIENKDADELLHQDCSHANYNVVSYHMGNVRGKHEPMLLAMAVFREYFGLRDFMPKDILVDFDNTIYSSSACDCGVVKSNLVEVSNNKKIHIVSGNDYKTAILPVFDAFGVEIKNDVWADASSILYVDGKKKTCVKNHLLNVDAISFVKDYLRENFGIIGIINDDESPSCFKVKPLGRLERSILVCHLNKFVFKSFGIKCLKAVPTGRTTIDIVTRKNNKANIFDACNCDKSTCLYIGDETEDYGNDYDIARACGKYIRVSNIYETNIILKILS